MAKVEDVGESQLLVAGFYKAVENSAQEQEKVLERILRSNSECEYLQRYGLNGRTDAKSFKELLPVIEHEDIEADINRILDGDTSPILTSEPVLHLYISSGTSSGKRKVFPVTRLRCLANLVIRNLMKAMISTSPLGGEAASLSMHFLSVGKIKVAPGGLEMAAGTTFLLTDPELTRGLPASLTSPYEVVLCEDYRQATYCHLLCGLLRSSEVTNIAAIFGSGLATAFSLFRDLWWEISRDIETGQLSNLVTDAPARAAVTKLLAAAAPNPQLAHRVRAECGKASWEGIVVRLWPGARYIQCAATGSMLQYVPYINFLTQSQLPIVSPAYVGSEAVYGLNPSVLNPPEETFYTLIPNLFAYFEFLPLRSDQLEHVEQQIQDLSIGEESEGEQARPVDIAGVKEGQTYGLLVTNGQGLWRYNVGDVLQCVGFHHQAPKFKFVGRQNVILSIHTDKTEEKELLEVVTTAAKLHLLANSRLYDFTSCTSLASLPGHYIIFWEITATGTAAAPIHVGEDALAEACLTMEAGFSEPYRRGRNIGTIGPLELRIVRPGTFSKLHQSAVDLGSGPGQYKTPRAYKAGSSALDILNAASVESCRSRMSPPHPTLNPLDSVISDI